MKKSYTSKERKKIFQDVLDYMVSDNGYSASASCRAVGVPLTTFLDWTVKTNSASVQYMRYHSTMVELMADGLRETANSPLIGEKTEYDEKGNVIKTTKGDMLGHRKLIVDTDKWLLSKIAAKKYGDRVNLDHGSQEGNPLMILMDTVSGRSLKPGDT